MNFLGTIGLVVVAAGIVASLTLLGFWWAEPETRRVAVIASAIASSLVIVLLRSRSRGSSGPDGSSPR